MEPATADLPSRASNAVADEATVGPWGRFLERVLVSGSPASRAVASTAASDGDALRPETGALAESADGFASLDE